MIHCSDSILSNDSFREIKPRYKNLMLSGSSEQIYLLLVKKMLAKLTPTQ